MILHNYRDSAKVCDYNEFRHCVASYLLRVLSNKLDITDFRQFVKAIPLPSFHFLFL